MRTIFKIYEIVRNFDGYRPVVIFQETHFDFIQCETKKQAEEAILENGYPSSQYAIVEVIERNI